MSLTSWTLLLLAIGGLLLAGAALAERHHSRITVAAVALVAFTAAGVLTLVAA